MDDSQLIRRLRRGDEAAFAALLEDLSSPLLRVAMAHVSNRTVAEEVVQETWLAVVSGLDRFEGRSSLKTWIFKILSNTAKTRGAKEKRTVPFSALAAADAGTDAPAVDPDRFFPPDHARYPDHWAFGPTSWRMPEDGLMAGETREVILAAIEQLPETQRTVISLRDIEGWPAEEVCGALEISEGNQRVLLHRARAKVRNALERYFDAVEQTVPDAALVDS